MKVIEKEKITAVIKDITLLGTKAGGEGIYRVSFNGVAGSLAMKDGKFLGTVMSNGKYSSEILANVKADLELQDRQYRRLYKKCADRIEKQANQAVDTQIMKGIAGVGKFAEGAASILPGMKKNQAPAKESFADKNGVGEVKRIMAQFEKSRESGIQPFEDNIRLLDYIHNEDASIAVSGENMYIPRLAPKRRILVVVDMQNDFISGSLGSKRGLEIVPAVVKKIQEYDPENVFATRDTHAEDYLSTQEGRLLPVEHCIKGTKGWEIAEDIKKLIPEDHIFDKPTFGSVELAEYMKQQNDKTDIEIELVGLCTDICVISNALLLKAYMPEVTISVDPSCCGGVTKEKHDAALEAMRSCQIQIVD